MSGKFFCLLALRPLTKISYMLAQLPSNMLLTRLRPSLYLPFCAALWSVVSGSTAGAKDFGGLVTIRFFLGLVEAPFFPGVSYVWKWRVCGH